MRSPVLYVAQMGGRDLGSERCLAERDAHFLAALAESGSDLDGEARSLFASGWDGLGVGHV